MRIPWPYNYMRFQRIILVVYHIIIMYADLAWGEDISYVNAYVHLSFYPLNLAVTRGTQSVGFVNVTVQSDVAHDMPLKLYICCVDQEVATLIKPEVVELPRNQTTTIFNISIVGTVLGRTSIRFYISRNVLANLTLLEGSDEVNHSVSSVASSRDRKDLMKNISAEEVFSTSLPPSGTNYTSLQTNNTSRKKELSINVTMGGNTSEATNAKGLQALVNKESNNTSQRVRKPRSISLKNNFDVSNYPEDNLQIWWLPSQYHIMVVNPPNPAEAFLNYIVMAMIAINLVGIGGQLDTEEVIYLLKKPLAVGVGLFCRFGVIPALALGLVELLQPSKLVSLGVLGLVCSPSEGANNLLILLVEGDLTLSATITTINNFATVALLPLWTILFETRIYSEPGRASIPFKEIFIIFGYMTSALTAGCIFQRRFPKQYNRFWLYLPAGTVLSFTFLLGVQAYNSYFIIYLVSVQVFFLATMLAACGFIFGAAVAFIARLPKAKLLVLTIETGMRTTYSISLLLIASLETPDGDIAKTTPVLASFLTLIPTFVAALIYRMVHKYRTRNYAETECTYLASNEDLSELCNGQEVVDAKETSM